MRDRCRTFAGWIVRHTVGTLPLFDLGLKLRGLRYAVSATLLERREAKLLVRRWGSIPSADVVTIIATYKRPEQLLRAVESAVAQDVESHVVVVVDDGGGLPPLPDHPRVFAGSLSKNQGTAGTTRNVGIRASNSRLLAFLDDDNTWRPNHLPLALRAHENGAEITYSALERVNVAGEHLDLFSVPFDRKAARESAFADTNGIVVRRGRGVRFSRVPRPIGTFPAEDWEFAYRLSKRHRIEHIVEPTVRYVVHPESYYTGWTEEDMSGTNQVEGHVEKPPA